MNQERAEPLGIRDNRRAYSLARANSTEAADAHTSTSSALDRWLAQKLLGVVGNPPVGLILWDGTELTGGQKEEPIARLRFRDRGALFELMMNPDLHFGDLYSVGRVEIEGNLAKFLEIVSRARVSGGRSFSTQRLLKSLYLRPRVNSLSGSKKNIYHHYDIGNDFYELWLDRSWMQYTCAYFPDPTLSLEQAQEAKLHHVCRKLRLRPGERVVEAGCGWGGLARFMVKHYGVNVRAYNISHEQIEYAQERAKREGLQDRLEYIEDDYRNITGSYDVFVSVGMLEHVGTQHYRELGAVIDRCLMPNGRGLIHSIGRNKPNRMNEWIEKRIFPGAYPPSLREMMDIFEPYSFSIQDIENLRLHYAKTLEHWLERYENNAERILSMFDESFVRAWRLYLSGSIAGFLTSSLQLFQVVFERPYNNDLPWNRAHLYER